MGVDMDHSPTVPSDIADPPAISINAQGASFDAPQEAFVHLSPTVRCEQDPTLFEFMSHSWDLPLGGTTACHPASFCAEATCPDACCLDTEPHFLADF